MQAETEAPLRSTPAGRSRVAIGSEQCLHEQDRRLCVQQRGHHAVRGEALRQLRMQAEQRAAGRMGLGAELADLLPGMPQQALSVGVHYHCCGACGGRRAMPVYSKSGAVAARDT